MEVNRKINSNFAAFKEGNGRQWKVIEGNRKNVKNSEGNEGNGGNIKVMAPYNRHDPKNLYKETITI